MASFSKILAAVAVFLAPVRLGAEDTRVHFLTALEQGKRQRIVLYGTSLTASSAWPARFQDTLRESYGNKVKVINAAGGGKDSRWGLANLTNRVIRQRPDIVFIEFAINDALEQSGLGVDESMTNLREMITRIHDARPYCDIIVMIMNPPTGNALIQRSRIAEYENGHRRVAKQISCRLVNFSPLWRNIIAREPELWQAYAPDGLHPNSKACDEVILPYLLDKIGFVPSAAP